MVPPKSKVVHVGMRGQSLVVFVEEPEELATERMILEVTESGARVSDSSEYRGTVQNDDIIWHLYQI